VRLQTPVVPKEREEGEQNEKGKRERKEKRKEKKKVSLTDLRSSIRSLVKPQQTAYPTPGLSVGKVL
jgi:hypothetical protein